MSFRRATRVRFRLVSFSLLLSLLVQFGSGAFLFSPAPAARAAGTTYYVDNTIVDANVASAVPDCTNYDPVSFTCAGGSASAYRSVADINAATFSPDDQILFRRGEVWREELVVPSSGSAGHPIVFGAFGSGARPIFNRTLDYAGWWEYGLVGNGGLERHSGSANDGGSDTFSNWETLVGAGNTVEAVTPGHTGQAALRITKPTVAVAEAALLSANGSLALDPATTYYVEFSGRRLSGTGDCRAFIKDATDNTYLNQDGVWRTNTDDQALYPASLQVSEAVWTAKSMTFTTPATGTSYALEFGVRYDQAASCEWDDLYVVQGSAHAAARVWTGYWGTSIESGILDHGVRMPQYGPYDNLDPATMAAGYFYNYGDTRTFYYRHDAGVPDGTQVGYWRHGVYLADKSYVTVQDIDIYGPGGSAGPGGTAYTGAWVGGNSSHVLLQDMDITYGNGYAAWSDSTTVDVTYDGLTAAYNGDTGLYLNSNGGAVRNCSVHDNARLATDVGDRGGIGVYLGGNLILEGNDVSHNGPDDQRTDFEVSVVAPVGPVDTMRNYVHDCIQGCVQVAGSGNGSKIAYNVIDGFGTLTYHGDDYNGNSGIRIGGGGSGVADVKVYNNVIAHGTAESLNASLIIVMAASTGTVVKNNIFYQNATPDISVNWGVGTSAHDYDHNLFYRPSYAGAFIWEGTTYDSLAAWQAASGQDADALLSEPLFSNASGSFLSADDYRPLASSPAIDAGTVITAAETDFANHQAFGAPDLGAFELLSSAKALTAFSFAGLTPEVAGTINEGSHTVALTVPYGTAVTALVPTITITGDSVSPSTGVAQDFTTPATYTVTAADGSTQAYTVTVTVTGAASDNNLSALVLSSGTLAPSFAAGTTSYTASVANDVASLTVTPTVNESHALVTVDGTAVTSGSASGSISLGVGSNSIPVVVTAQNGATNTYTLAVTRAASSIKAITAFSFTSPAVSGTVSETNHTVSLTVPRGTPLGALVPTITFTGASISPLSAVAADFTSPVTYTVTAGDGSTQAYVVTVTVQSGGSSGGGGGSSHPKPRPRDLKVTGVNGNQVGLSLSVDDASEMIFSPADNFTGAAWEKFAPTKTYAKADGQTKIYLRFKSSYGILSDLATLDIPTGSTGEGAVSPYPTGTLLKTASSFKTYVIIEGKKKWIPTPQVFTQLGYQWTEIKELTSDELNLIPDYEDNLIRAVGSYQVYLVVNGVRRHIPNPEVFLNYGFDWNDVKDVPSTTVDQYQNTYLIQEDGTDKVYYLRSDGIRKLIPSTEIFNSYNDKLADIQIVSPYEMTYYPASSLIRLNGSNDIYLIEGSTKKHITSSEAFSRLKLDWNRVMSVNQMEFDHYANGGDLK